MKVLFTFGGIPHYLNALLEKLQKKGIEITVVTPHKGHATIGKGVKMTEGGTYRHLNTSEKKMFYGKSGFPALPEIVRQERPDILVIGWPYFLQIFFQPRLKKAMKACSTRLIIREIPFQTPPYGQIRSYFQQHPVYNEQMQLKSKGLPFYIRQWITAHIRKFCYRQAVCSLNYSTAAYAILPSYGVRRSQIHVTYNATDTEALLQERNTVLVSPPLLPASGKRLLHIGRLVKWKRVDLLIDAFARVSETHPQAELVIIGDGPELENLKRQATDAKLTVLEGKEAHVLPETASAVVRFIGAVYEPVKLGAYMHESTIYILAGMGGLSINDAMTYGLPVICSVCDSTERDLVIDGKNGYFFREGDAESLAEKIELLFASPERCREMGKESERIIREKINLESVSMRYIEAFHTCIHS